jgi:hypothetical protein
MAEHVAHPLREHRPHMRAPIHGAVLVTRGTRWGNPYPVEVYGRDRALERFGVWLMYQLDLHAQLPEIRGRRLACYCQLDERCHADVLARLANRETGA